jgi:hypothetical protein
MPWTANGTMTGWTGGIRAAAAALLVMGVAATARAAEAPPTQNPNAFVPFDSFSAPHKSLQLDSNGRWGLRLDIDPPVGKDQNVDLKDVSAGAFFHITPSMRIGGSVGLGDRQADTQKILPQDTNAPRVHLETKFKF